MSTTYGTYLTEDEKKKLEEGAVTPSSATTPTTETPTTTPTTGTTGTPMTYSQYVGNGMLSGNYNSGVNYYNNVFNKASGNIDTIKQNTIDTSQAQKEETHRQADIAKERSVVDARSDYQKAVGTYGSNAETLASGGLGGSGYGEWLQGNAYATMRGGIQNAQATATAQKNAADVLHNQNVLAAERDAATSLAAAEAAKEKGIYELGLGLSEDRANAYNSLMEGAQSGASLESLKNDARWGDLTPGQKTAIQNAATEYATNMAEEEGKQAVQDMINNGYTAEEIKGSDAYNELDTATKAEVDTVIEKNEEQRQAVMDQFLEDYKDVTSLSELESAMKSEAIPESTRAEIIAKWQEGNANDAVKELSKYQVHKTTSEYGIDYLEFTYNGEAITADDILNDIDAGLYGDSASDVAKVFADAMIAYINSADTTKELRAEARRYARVLKKYLDSQTLSTLENAYKQADKK